MPSCRPYRSWWLCFALGCAEAVRASGLVAASSWSFDYWVGAWRFVFGLARSGLAVGFHLLCHALGLAMSARLCLPWW